MLNNNQSKQNNILLSLLSKFFLIFNFSLRHVNTRGLNNVKEHKTNHKNGEGAYMCSFHMYSKFFMRFLQILHGLLSWVHCLI